jgi:hypothetical protein
MRNHFCNIQIAKCTTTLRAVREIANCKLTVFACVFAVLVHHPLAAQTFSFDDIEFWVGSGANRAAVVIDWVDDSSEPPALAWGYRWDGIARGSDMLAAVVAADSRLFAKLRGVPTSPDAIFGLGYDADDDGAFSLDDGTVFDDAGFAFNAEPTDGVAAVSSLDYYVEGWLAGFWHYGVAEGNPFDGGIWADSKLGMASRVLTDGAWDSWTFESPIRFTEYATNPQPAQPPFRPGDFNHDAQVDAADYEEWRRAFGSHSNLAADGNLNGAVDAADYVVWRDHLAERGSPLSDAVVVPEPRSLPVLMLVLMTIHFAVRNALSERRRTHESHDATDWYCCRHDVRIQRPPCGGAIRCRSRFVRRGDHANERVYDASGRAGRTGAADGRRLVSRCCLAV